MALLELLDERLAAHGVDVSVREGEVAAVGPDVMRRVWSAFQDFAALPVDGLHDGLHVPAGFSDLDSLSCERAVEEAPDRSRNIEGRPPYVRFGRRLYLVNHDDEFADWDSTGLEVYLTRAPFTERGSSAGSGGPPTNDENGVAAWAKTIEEQPWWPALYSDEAIVNIRRY